MKRQNRIGGDKTAHAYNLERLNFLIVDDNRHMRMLVKTILHALGVKLIAEAEDGTDAFKVMKIFPSDIVICDMKMEPLDGLDFARLIRTGSDSPNPFVPIILLTGNTDQQTVVNARDAGINEFLAKPISANSLYRRIVAVIERPRSFIRTKHYFGPDRRRKQAQLIGPDKRKPINPSLTGNPGNGLSQEEVNTLLRGAPPARVSGGMPNMSSMDDMRF